MDKQLHGQQDFLNAFIKAAQYLAGLTIQQDIWIESGKVLVNFFGADLCAFGKRRETGEIEAQHLTVSDQIPEHITLGPEIKEAISEVMESSFLTTRLVSTPDSLHVVFLPITQKNQVSDVILVGHKMAEPIPKERLNVYLATARLIGTTTERLVSEVELRKHRDHLDELVKDRTAVLAKTNEQLQQEIIEREEAEKKLRKSEAEKKAILEGMTTNVRFVNKKREILWINKAGLSEIDKSLKDVIGHKCYEFWGDDPKKPCADCPANNVIKTRKPTQTIRHLPNGMVWDFRSEPVFDNYGNIIGIVELANDITDRSRLEAALQHSRKMEGIATLTGGIAHDYNNLMSIIIGNLSMAMEEAGPGSLLADFLKEANTASRKVRDLTHELMSLSKGGDPVKEVGSIVELLKSALDAIPAESGISVNEIIPRELWQVPHDPYKIGAIFRNVVTNAVESMTEGGALTVKAENLTVEDNDQYPGLPLNTVNYVHISIQDQGVGILEEHLEKIFDPYFSTKKMGASKGMGLGLATSYAIIKKHGGHIKIDSSPGAGTTVNIYLPAESQPTGADSTSPEKDDSAFPMKRLLVMDDEEMLRNLARQMLERMGYAVETVEDGLEAIKKYKKQKDSGEPFDAVILDLTIKGGMGGEQTMRELLKINPDVKAIVCSGYFNDPVMSDFEKHGFRGVMAKPYQKADLESVLKSIL